jgi:signal transduction histidine kinase
MSLTQRFAAVAGTVMLAACVGLALYSGERAKRDVVAAAEAYNLTLSRLIAKALWDKHRDYLRTEGMTDELGVRLSLLDIRLSALDTDVRGLLAGSPIAKVKLYTAQGFTAYSTNHSDIGADKSGNAGFLAAVGGGVSSALHFKDSFNAFDGEKTERSVLETYAPIRGDAGAVEGVIEVYHDLTPILAQMHAARREQWVAVGVTMIALLALLVLFVWRSEKVVTRARNAAALAQREADRAQYRERMKSEFLANISHELRSPLNAILGFAEVMQNRVFGPITPARYESYVTDIIDSGGYLLRTVDDILDMTRIDAGQVQLELKPIDLTDLLHRCVRQAGHAQRRPDVVLAVLAPPEPIRALIDENRLRQALGNLLSNAVKFTRGAGEVTVGAERRSDGGVAVTVRDTGIGIPADRLTAILTPFDQVAGAYARQTGGIGLGLPITKALVELHGGTLAIESQPGAGTTVTITLPAEHVIGADGTAEIRAA